MKIPKDPTSRAKGAREMGHPAYGEIGLVRINDWRWWEEKIRKKAV